MHSLLVIGFGLAFGAFWLLGNRYPKGEGPMDRLPAGLGAASSPRVETVADGTRYRVIDYPIGADGRSFHVAEVKGTPAWISFWADARTGARTMCLSRATAGALNDLRKDWAV